MKSIEKEYKKLEKNIIISIFNKLKYNKKQFYIKKTKHKEIGTRIYLTKYSSLELKYIFDMLQSQLKENHTLINLNIQYESKQKKHKAWFKRKKTIDGFVEIFLKREYEINTHVGLLRIQGILE